MPISVGVIMDPISAINIKKDSTFAMLLEAKTREYSLFYMEMNDLVLKEGKACAFVRQLDVFDDHQSWFNLGNPELKELSTLDVILMRKDPPFDMDYIYATYLLERAELAGTLVVNKPSSLRDCNEKLFTAWFPELCPSTLVASNKSLIKSFIEENADVILKPLDGMGGSSIFRVKKGDPNTNVIIETLTQNGHQLIMAQTFIPDIKNGDKRILMVNGKPIPFSLARIPAEGETRGNLAAGGSGVAQPLSDHDKLIAEKVGPELVRRGLYFVGLDVIGNFITEINVTSPTCIKEIDYAFNTNIAGELWDALEPIVKNKH